MACQTNTLLPATVPQACLLSRFGIYSALMTSRQLVVLSFCVALFALGQFHRASGSVFTPVLMERFAVSAATVAGLVSAMYFATIAVQVPFGAALDRIGARRVLVVCILLVAVGTGLFALAASYNAVLMSRILIGIGLASMGAATHVIIARNFSAADFGYASGLVVTLGGIGGLLGTYPLAFALARVPWVVVFGCVALLTLLLAAAVWRAVRPGVRQDVPAEQVSEPGSYMSLLRIAEYRNVLILSAVTFGPITTITGLWGGPFLQDALGLSPDTAGMILLALFGATIAGGYIFGILDRRAPSRPAIIIGGASLSVTCLAILAAFGAAGAGMPVLLLLTMVFAQQFYISLGAQMRHAVPDPMLGRAAALLSVVAVAAIPLLQIGFGMLLDAGAAAGFSVDDQYRLAFAGLGGLIFLCLGLYVSGEARRTR